MSETYGALLGRRSARRLLGALCAAWLSFGMISLGLLLTVERASGSFGPAGIAVAAFSAGAGLLAPLRGRLLDRRGVRPWLLLFAAVYGSALLLLALLAQVGADTWLLVLCAAAAGLGAPPLVATARGSWSSTVDGPLLRRAYALTALIGDVGLVAAPALAGLMFVVAPWSPLVVAAVAAVVAAGIMSRSAPPAKAPDDAVSAEARSPLASGSLRTLLGVELALGAALGLVEVAVPAAATRWGTASLSGFLLGAFALGSVAGGLWFGRRSWRRLPEERYLLASLVLALALAPPVVATSAAMLAPLLIVAGLGYGPATISLFEALDASAPVRGTEAFTWVTTAGAIGGAVGAASSSWVTVALGTWAPFAAASAVLALAAGGALLYRRR
jgi:MFS family permease